MRIIVVGVLRICILHAVFVDQHQSGWVCRASQIRVIDLLVGLQRILPNQLLLPFLQPVRVHLLIEIAVLGQWLRPHKERVLPALADPAFAPYAPLVTILDFSVSEDSGEYYPVVLQDVAFRGSGVERKNIWIRRGGIPTR